jgi:hypothetical protein
LAGSRTGRRGAGCGFVAPRRGRGRVGRRAAGGRDVGVEQRGAAGRAQHRVLRPFPQALHRFDVAVDDGRLEALAGLDFRQVHDGVDQGGPVTWADVLALGVHGRPDGALGAGVGRHLGHGGGVVGLVLDLDVTRGLRIGHDLILGFP